MVDTSRCGTLVRGKVARFTKLDACGRVVPGPRNSVITEGLISVTMTPTNLEGSAISVTNAAGNTCVSDTPAPKFQYFTDSIALCGVNPDLIQLLTGQELVMSATAGVASGFTIGTDTDADAQGFAIELWTGVGGIACGDTESVLFGYMLQPFVKGGQLSDVTWQNDAINFTVANAQTKDNNGWGVGPYNITTTSLGAPSPLLAALGSKKHFLSDFVTLAPPVDVCGAVPVGVPATLITAGIPATLTPANSYPPATLATIGAVTKTPTTAWTVGQYVTLQDGTKAHWSGTAWIAGPA